MKIAILGSGDVGMTLAGAFLARGHQVMIGTRHTQKEGLLDWLTAHPAAQAGTYSETAAFGDVVVLCTGWTGTKAAIEMAGIWNFKKKIVIDVTNPLDGKGPDAMGRLHLSAGNAQSGGEQVQNWLQEAHVVKALNSIGNNGMIAPSFAEGTPAMFIAGNDDLAKLAVTDILGQLGWKDVVDTGGIAMSRHLESLAVIWCAYGFRTGTWDHAFALLRK
ncbi:NAD(P)-binding domain-containing protein [Chitinophaga sp.]|uniref:NADPH-dependent F420 reductase n=1 Tax=Chitinophaga sp. TaxID=1869181 RepID=UPI0026079459|nr:NAD(P)-binding domain-containing protein [uncultured Chitinophaga sp.]